MIHFPLEPQGRRVARLHQEGVSPPFPGKYQSYGERSP
jgi:hypothetical protein